MAAVLEVSVVPTTTTSECKDLGTDLVVSKAPSMDDQRQLAVSMRSFPVDDIIWQDPTALLTVSAPDQPAARAILAQIKASFQQFDVKMVFNKLIQCGGMIRLALKSAGDKPCSTAIVGLTADYQVLCHDTTAAASNGAVCCVKALRAHQLMKKSFLSNDPEKAFKKFEACAKLALLMEAEADKLMQKSEDLRAKAQKALQDASEDKNASHREKKAIEDKLQDLSTKKARFSAAVESLSKDLATAEKKEAEATKEAKQITFGFAAKTVFTAGIYLACETTTADLNKRRDDAASVTRDLAQQKREQNANLQETLASMQNMQSEKTHLEQTVLSISCCYQTLGKVVTVFADAKQYWGIVARHCQSLAEMKDSIREQWDEDDGFESIEDEFFQSCCGWAALGKVNYEAYLACIEAKAQIDNVMVELPVGEACEEEIKKLTIALLDDLVKEAEVSRAQSEANSEHAAKVQLTHIAGEDESPEGEETHSIEEIPDA